MDLQLHKQLGKDDTHRKENIQGRKLWYFSIGKYLLIGKVQVSVMWLCLPGGSEYELKMGKIVHDRLNFIHRYRSSVNSEITYILCNAHYYNFLQI